MPTISLEQLSEQLFGQTGAATEQASTNCRKVTDKHANIQNQQDEHNTHVIKFIK